MTDDYLQRQLRDLYAGPIAAEVLRLRAEKAAGAGVAPPIGDTNACMTFGALLKDLGMPSDRLDGLPPAAWFRDAAAMVERWATRGGWRSERAELERLRKESKRERAEKAEAKLAEVARILGGTGDVVERARANVRALEAARGERRYAEEVAGKAIIDHDAARAWAGRMEMAVANLKKEVERRDAAIRDRNEFAAKAVEGFLEWAYRPGAEWTHKTLHLAAKARAAELRRGDVRGVIAAVDCAADVRRALGVEPVAAPTEERVLFACSKCSPQNAKSIEDQINRVVSMRVEAERAKAAPLTDSVPPMRRDANGALQFDTSNWGHQPPTFINSREALADIAYCRRDPCLRESRLIARELLERRAADSAAATDAVSSSQPSVLPLRCDDGRVLSVGSIAGQAHPDAQPDGFPAELTLAMGGMRCQNVRYVRMDSAQRKAAMNQQRFSLGTKFHEAIALATSGLRSEFRGSPGVALLRAVEALGAAVEEELSRRP
ncbi:MAG: hypothetical protein MUC36_10380 [Planctomycetes bacterium]|jgi:hypothetical protein|nr:hypothetical protein [Planctomycetota bacterium]